MANNILSYIQSSPMRPARRVCGPKHQRPPETMAALVRGDLNAASAALTPPKVKHTAARFIPTRAKVNLTRVKVMLTPVIVMLTRAKVMLTPVKVMLTRVSFILTRVQVNLTRVPSEILVNKAKGHHLQMYYKSNSFIIN